MIWLSKGSMLHPFTLLSREGIDIKKFLKNIKSLKMTTFGP
jgi:hypothetical protein